MAKENDISKHGPREIWDNLSGIDVSKYVAQKGNLDYLSWGGAWILLMDVYPQATFEFANEEDGGVFYFRDESAEVRCSVTINETTRSIHLPVMDFRNNAIHGDGLGPDSREINDCKMRALVKCLSLHGLGTYLYVGGEPPVIEEDKESSPPKKESSPKKKSKKKSSPKKTETKQEEANGEDNNETQGNKVALTLKVFAENAASTDSLLSLYRANKEVIDQMEKDDPKSHKDMMDVFSRRKTALLEAAQ